MRSNVGIVLMLTVAVLLLAQPSAASAKRWQVFANDGKAVGSVIKGLNRAGASAGIIRGGGHPVANVFRLVQDEHDGWMLCTGLTDEPWQNEILRKGRGRFMVGDVDGSNPVVRAVKVRAGYWVFTWKVEGTWTRVGSMRGGCPGAWAAGAAKWLLWRSSQG